jgi:hypothetical protein
MREVELYRQCTLERVTEKGRSIDVAYIPEKYAKIGKGIEHNNNGEWEGNVWTVTKMSNKTADGKDISRKFHKGWNNNI